MDLNVVRLCFQVFLPDEHGKITRIVPPVVSQPIHDKSKINFNLTMVASIQGPVVQSIVSLTSWLRGQLVKGITTL